MLTGYDISTKVEQDVVDCFESSGASDHEKIRKKYRWNFGYDR